MSAPDLAALRDAVGDGFEEHEARRVDGVAIATTLRPADGEALGRVLAALSAERVGAVVHGGGSRLGVGNPPRRPQVFLSTQRLTGVDVFEPEEGVCHAAAGTPLLVLQEKVAAEGWQLPFDPPGDGSTVGGAIAAAALGPRVLGYGMLRNAVLGLEVAHADGRRTRCGGRVVKNVTGYDLAKLYVGSLGSLGVIEGAWLRLHPLPHCVRRLEAQLPVDAACELGLASARRPTARVAAVVAREDGALRLVAELAGDAPAVERDAAELSADLAAVEVPESSVDEIRELQGALGVGSLRFRIAVRPSRLASAVQRLRGAGAELLVYPGVTLVYAGISVAEGDESAVSRAFGLAAETAREAGGSFVVEEAPAWAKRGRDVFAAGEGALALARALKQGFDPLGVLNAGRFHGFL